MKMSTGAAAAILVALCLKMAAGNAANDTDAISTVVDNQNTTEIPKIEVLNKSEEKTSHLRRTSITKEDLETLLRHNKDDAEISAGNHDRVNSAEARRLAKERRLLYPLEESESAERSLKQQQGVPFFIADDGKSIQLPQSDVIYNTETGEILIRNRHPDGRNLHSAEDTTTGSSREKTSTHGKNYFNIRPSGLGFKNLQGFFIADTEGNLNMPFLYPLSTDSAEVTTSKSTERSKKERRESEEILDISEDRHARRGIKTLETIDEGIRDHKNETKNDLHHSIGDKMLGDDAKSDVLNHNEQQLNEYEETTLTSKHDALKAVTDHIVDHISDATYSTKESNRITDFTVPGEQISATPNYDQLARSAKQSSGRMEDEAKRKILESQDQMSSQEILLRQGDHRNGGSLDLEEHHHEDIHGGNVLERTRPNYSGDNYNDSYKRNDESAVEGEALPSILTSEATPTTETTIETTIGLRTRVIELSPELFAYDPLNTSKVKNSVEHIVSEDAEAIKSGTIIYSPTRVNESGVKIDKEENKNSNDVKDEEGVDEIDGDVNSSIGDDLKEKAEDQLLDNENISKLSLYSTTPYTTTEQPNALEALRIYLEDIYLRGPIAVVVDTEEDNLNLTWDAWRAMEANGGAVNTTDVVLIGFDGNGITWMSHHKISSLQHSDLEARAFRKALYGLKPTSQFTSAPGDAVTALTKAGLLLPYDSAVFLFGSGRTTEAASAPTNLVALLLSKRIKLYAVSAVRSASWLSGAARVSGGAAIRALAPPSLDHQREHRARDLRALSVYYDAQDEEEELDFDEEQTLVLRGGLSGAQSLSIPVDSSARSLTVSVSGGPDLAVLYGPEGSRVDLLDPSSVSAYSPGSEVLAVPPWPAIKLAMVLTPPSETEDLQEVSEPFQGVWTLMVHGNGTAPYGIRVGAETSVRVMAKLFEMVGEDDMSTTMLKLAVGGTVNSVTEVNILDEQGSKLTHIPYRYKDDVSEDISDVMSIETLRATESGTVVREVRLPGDVSPGKVFRVQVTGRNDRDEPFVRLSQELTMPARPIEKSSRLVQDTELLGRGLGDIEAERGVNFNLTKQSQITSYDGVPLSVVQIGAVSKLHGAPGQQIQIHFEVTNNRENSVYFRFGVKDDQYFLRNMVPQRQWINGGQTLNVIVTVGITSSAENNVRDTITFTANGLDQSTISAYVYVETDGRISSDKSRPYLRHEFRGDCLGYLGSSDCASRNWALDLTARDTDSGLLRISVSPGAVVYQSGFYAGGREESRARYTASCCSPSVIISAADLAGNVASYEVNVSQYFTPATIAAIVLGVLLFIALVVVVVLVVRACLRRRRASRDLPSYQSQRVARTP